MFMFTAPVLSPSAGTCRSYGAVIGVTTGPYKYPTPTELKTPVRLHVSLTLAFTRFGCGRRPLCLCGEHFHPTGCNN